ncbi:MAG: glycosyltransferase [Acidocella sp.]|nr:glycosyltransferase [Acidocella sp.]
MATKYLAGYNVQNLHLVPTTAPSFPDLPTGGSTTRRVFLYSHDTFGLGHLRRNLAIAHRLLAAEDAFSVLLLTGSPVADIWDMPTALEVQPLPPVVKTGAERYESREPGKLFAMVKGYREALILKLVLRDRPDVLLVDHAPAGMNGELLSTLALIRQELPHTRVVLGLRDILDSPATVRALWAEQNIPALLEVAYDDILVYGSRSLFDVAEGYGLTPAIAARLRYCGHVVAPALGEAAGPCWDVLRAAGRPVVLVTAGGGGDGLALIQAYLHGLPPPGEAAFHSAIVTGPLMPAAERAFLERLAYARADVELITYTTNLLPSLKAAALVVAMAGYNTTAELIALRKSAILVPRAAPRAEQLMRARQMAALGLARMVEPDENLTTNLAALIPEALRAPPPTSWAQLDLGGAERVVEILSVHELNGVSVA